MLPVLPALTSSRNSCKRVIAFEGIEIHHPAISTIYSPPLSSYFFLFSLVRAGKFEAVKASYIKYGDRVDIAVIDDLITGDFTDVLKGVHAVIHVATPLPGRQDLQATIDVSTRHFTSRHMSI